MSIQINGSSIKLEIKNKTHEILFSEAGIINLRDKITTLVNSLQENDFSWKSSNNLLVFDVVNSSIKLFQKYKKMTELDKKNICFQIIEKFIEDEVNKLDIDTEMKIIIQQGVDTIVEPIIELTLLKFFTRTNCLNQKLSCFR